ncbi:hypothetical protein CHUAL_000219 [Chamberlinius hualienensis]
MYTRLLIIAALGAISVIHAAPVGSPPAEGDNYQIGVGIADCTGPAAEVNLMGYAMMDQTASGIHLRQFSRAFIIGDGTNRVAIVSVDAGMITTAVTIGVMEGLEKRFGGLYNVRNVLLSGTHTHSGPAGFFQYFMYDVTSLGFINQTYFSLVDGIVESISRAHDNIKPGRIYHSQGDLTDASINRSPYSYEQNPAEERARYQYNTDKRMVLLKLVDTNDQPIGMIK